jgi:hypothetical protein
MSIHHFATAKGHPLLQFPCSIDMPGDLSITVEALCKGLPTSFCNFISHVRSLDFDRKLNYQYLHSILSWVSKSETAKIDQPNNVLPPTHSCDRQVPHTFQQSMSSKATLDLSHTIICLEMLMTEWENLREQHKVLEPWTDIGLCWATKYYIKMDDTNACVITMCKVFKLMYNCSNC